MYDRSRGNSPEVETSSGGFPWRHQRRCCHQTNAGDRNGCYNAPISEFAWFRRDMPWLGRGFVYCVDAAVENELRDNLARLDFALFTIDGRDVDTGAELHRELARTFDFPDYYGGNWDAFNDCFDDPPFPPRSALLWRGAQRLATTELRAFAEAIAVLHNGIAELSADGRQLELFLLGTGRGFRRPTDPVDPGWQLSH